MNFVIQTLTEEEWKHYNDSMKSWSTEQLQDELIKLYTEVVAGLLPQDAYERAKLLVEARLHGTMYSTTDDDYDRAMKGI